jgi:hypothetical protein
MLGGFFVRFESVGDPVPIRLQVIGMLIAGPVEKVIKSFSGAPMKAVGNVVPSTR